MLRRRLYSMVRCYSNCNAYTQRTHSCGELTAKNEGERVSVMGFLAYRRMNRFLVIRDTYGSVQATIPSTSKLMSKDIPYESVVKVEGIVRDRGKDKNENMATGDIEIEISSLDVLSRAPTTLPLYPEQKSSEKTRLQHRYLDLRTENLQRALKLRAQIVHKMRRFLTEEVNFVEVETPTLFRRTPGGAAEFLVPTGPPNLGMCYSLPQSPQQFKQLLMVGGMDRYFQIARCYRDEGAKGDRQPEFTQVDLELSFTYQEGVLQMVEDLISKSWPSHLEDIRPSFPFPRLRYDDVMRLYGVDKPDLRIPWQIQPATNVFEFLRPVGSSSSWVANVIVCKGQAKTATTAAKKEWKRILEMNKMARPFAVATSTRSPFSKNLSASSLVESFGLDEDDALIVCWGEAEGVQWSLGQLRNLIADSAGLRKERKIVPLWVVDFPLFSFEDDKMVSTHHPFTAPIDEHREWIYEKDKLDKITGQHYDLVMNGVELGGGSIRIYDAMMQKHVLDMLGENSQEMSHLLEALSMGAPPHGGFALGLDRYIALMHAEGDPTLPVREVIAFPKTKEGRDLMSKAPAIPSDEELKRYGIQFVEKKEKKSDTA